MQNATFQTDDGVIINADFYTSSSIKRRVVLALHMMPETKESWREFAEAMLKKNIACLAIDLRGHGKSTSVAAYENIILNYKNFSDKDQQKSILDVNASILFLQENGFDESDISFIGASIGANLALSALDCFANTKLAVLLSPGLDYHGVTTKDAAEALGKDKKVYILASEEDEYSALSSREIYDILKTKNSANKLDIFQGLGHGTNMFVKDPRLIAKIADWFQANIL